MIDAKRLNQIKRRAEQADPVVGDIITNGELLDLIRDYRVALKELRTIYDRHDVSCEVEDLCHANGEGLVDEEDVRCEG